MQRALNWLKDLISFKSVESQPLDGYPFGEGVGKCLEYALNMAERSGFTVKNLDGYCGYAEIGEGELFGVLCHLDVVPEGSGWSFPPYGAVISDGVLYGRGALDDKAPFVACFEAALRLLESGKKPTKRLRFILGCDEESGWKCMERYFATEEIPQTGFSPDADFPVINCEKGIVYHTIKVKLPDGLTELTAGERANVVPAEATARFADGIPSSVTVSAERENFAVKDGKISAFGVSAHGSHPEKGDNALTKLLGALSSEYPILAELYSATGSSDGSGAKLKLSDDKSGALTMNLGTAKTENGYLIFELDIRYPVSYTRDSVTARLKEALPSYEVEQGFFHEPLYVDKDSSLVRTLLAAYEKVTGNKAEPIAIGGGTYARALPLGVAFGPCFPDVPSAIHEKDECISLAHFEKLIKIYGEALDRLCF